MHMRLRSSVGSLAAVAAALVLAGCDVSIGVESPRVVQRETKEFNVAGVPDVVLTTFDGAIEIRAWDRPDVSVEIEKRGSSKREVDGMQVITSQSGNRVTVEVKTERREHVHFGFGVSRSARLIASVPRQANLEVRSGDGSLSVERVSGTLQMTTGDGTVTATEIAGDLRVHSGDGSITLNRVDGGLDVDTGDGTISVNGKLERVRMRTGDGSLRLRADSGSRMTDDWSVDTGDGSIDLELPEPFDADVDVHTNGGRVSVNATSVKGEISRDTVRGQIGAGGRNLRVRSGDGTITISRS